MVGRRKSICSLTVEIDSDTWHGDDVFTSVDCRHRKREILTGSVHKAYFSVLHREDRRRASSSIESSHRSDTYEIISYTQSSATPGGKRIAKRQISIDQRPTLIAAPGRTSTRVCGYSHETVARIQVDRIRFSPVVRKLVHHFVTSSIFSSSIQCLRIIACLLC